MNLRSLLRWESTLVVVLIAEFIFFSSVSPYFLDIWTLSDATFNFTEKALIALPLAMLIVAGEIDISVAAIIALASVAMGLAAAPLRPCSAAQVWKLAGGLTVRAFSFLYVVPMAASSASMIPLSFMSL